MNAKTNANPAMPPVAAESAPLVDRKPASSRHGVAPHIVQALCIYHISAALVFTGVFFGTSFLQPCTEHPNSTTPEFLQGLLAWDGKWYHQIATGGYSYDESRQSSVAFYPAYPLAAAGLSYLMPIDERVSLVIISHCSLAAAMILLAVYVRVRYPDAQAKLEGHVLLVVGLFPTTFYFRMGYSESLFLLLCVAAMLGMEKGWRSVIIAVLIGAATATRPVAAALLAPFSIYLFGTRPTGTSTFASSNLPARRLWHAMRGVLFCIQTGMLLLVACWGIIAYLGYQWCVFREPFAFMRTQEHWGRSIACVSLMEYAWRLVTFRPVRAVYDPVTSCYWGNYPPRDNALFSLMFANPLYFIMAAMCIAIGVQRRWLNKKEAALSAFLLLIPYSTQADRMCMASHARFASVVFPVYLVLGHALTRLPLMVVTLVAAFSAVMLGFYSALFSNWYWYY